MKKVLFALIAFLAINLTATAGSAGLFSYDEAEFENSLTALNELEDYVNANEGVNYAAVAAVNSDLVKDISEEPAISITDAKRNRVLGIPSFLWGCVFGVVGLAVVYFVAEDKEETKKALYGCITAGVVSLVLWLVAFAGAAATAAP